LNFNSPEFSLPKIAEE